jgi:hypothetical protein
VNSPDTDRPFVATTLYCAGALLIWLGAFTAVYVFAAVACAKQFADERLVGLPIVTVVALITCLAAAIVTATLLRKGAATSRARAHDEHERFLGFLAFATSVLAIIALTLLVLPPLTMPACRAS